MPAEARPVHTPVHTSSSAAASVAPAGVELVELCASHVAKGFHRLAERLLRLVRQVWQCFKRKCASDFESDERLDLRLPFDAKLIPLTPLSKTIRARCDTLASPSGSRRIGDQMAGFLFRLETLEGVPAEPPTLASAVLNWKAGDTIPLGRTTLRVVAVRDDDADQPPGLIVEEASLR
jgi:hypothetical protein